MTETEIKNKDAYFIIVRTSKEKIDFAGLKYQTDNKIEPIIIYKNAIDKEDKSFLEEIVFKFKKRLKKNEANNDKPTKYKIKFIEEEEHITLHFH